ncbi:MAG: hypothetical protein ACK4NR_02950 [Micavibrio sp.]
MKGDNQDKAAGSSKPDAHDLVRLSDAFHEREIKLNASNVSTLESVRDFIIKAPHFATLNDKRLLPSWINDLPLNAPQEETGLRLRTYFDNAALTAAGNNVEIRVEYRGDKSSDGWPYKQVIKIGSNESTPGHVLDRLEYPAKLKKATPDLSVIDGPAAKYLKRIFDVKDLRKVHLLPLIVIAGQRWRLLYHPDANRDVRVEVATDVGRGMTVGGHQWNLFQVEMEMKQGDAQVLALEESILRHHFMGLTPETRSKPTDGFEALKPLLAQKKVRKWLEKAPQDGVFRPLPDHLKP